MADNTQTDVSRPQALPTASLLPQRRVVAAPQSTEGRILSSEEYLAELEEQMNVRVDAEVKTLLAGMQELVELASVSYLLYLQCEGGC